MGNYLLHSERQRLEMLDFLGVGQIDELFAQLPNPEGGMPPLPEGMSELELSRVFSNMATKNTLYPTVFRGAGAYRHYIPAVVSAVASKETLLTAYTPYQAEMSQGILQSIFEYQTMICMLTGLDAANASVYDGASAAAEAVAMCRERSRKQVLFSGAAHPNVIRTVKTYCRASGMDFELIPVKDGLTDLAALEAMTGDGTACVFIAQPNYNGLIEDASKAGTLARQSGAKFVMSINPIAAALLKTPAECGADIAVGEGQPLGLPLSFGGPYLGFMAAASNLTRRLPGRIVGQTADHEGRRAFVLTLQAREQHIRREKAGSNICSNQALCAMTAAAYLAAMGPGGLREVAAQCVSKAHYLAGLLGGIPGFELKYGGEFFHEFVTNCPGKPDLLLDTLSRHGILGGLPVDGGLLWCVTEMNTRAEIDNLAALVREVCAL